MQVLCTHAPTRRFAWYAYNCVTDKNDWHVIGCCDCGKILLGSDAAYRDYLTQHGLTVDALAQEQGVLPVSDPRL